MTFTYGITTNGWQIKTHILRLNNLLCIVNIYNKMSGEDAELFEKNKGLLENASKEELMKVFKFIYMFAPYALKIIPDEKFLFDQRGVYWFNDIIFTKSGRKIKKAQTWQKVGNMYLISSEDRVGERPEVFILDARNELSGKEQKDYLWKEKCKQSLNKARRIKELEKELAQLKTKTDEMDDN